MTASTGVGTALTSGCLMARPSLTQPYGAGSELTPLRHETVAVRRAGKAQEKSRAWNTAPLRLCPRCSTRLACDWLIASMLVTYDPEAIGIDMVSTGWLLPCRINHRMTNTTVENEGTGGLMPALTVGCTSLSVRLPIPRGPFHPLCRWLARATINGTKKS